MGKGRFASIHTKKVKGFLKLDPSYRVKTTQNEEQNVLQI